VLGAQGDKVAESRHFPYGGERWRWPEDSTFPTDYRFAGQRWEQALGIYTMGARWYDPALGRWLSADVIIPGTVASNGGGAATLGYDNQVRLTLLTVGFHETQFLSVIGEENREILEDMKSTRYSWGPETPQALNRYAYCANNALRYVDPTGHDDDDKNPWPIDAIGWRIELSVMPLMFGADVDLDILYNLNSGETDVFVSLGPQIVGEGISANTGPVFVFGLPDNAGYEGADVYLGGTIVAEFGGEADVCVGLEEHQGETKVAVFIGGGVGAEGSAYGGVSVTFRVTDWVISHIPVLAPLFTRRN
jgi:RHS repeat-associated protein